MPFVLNHGITYHIVHAHGFDKMVPQYQQPTMDLHHNFSTSNCKHKNDRWMEKAYLRVRQILLDIFVLGYVCFNVKYFICKIILPKRQFFRFNISMFGC